MIFGRGELSRVPAPDASGPRDASLPSLSSEQAFALHQLAEKAFKERGVRAEGVGGGVLSDGVRQFGLHNLSLAVAGTPWRKWLDVVRAHVDAVLAGQAADEAPVTPDMLLLKLRLAADLPQPPDFDTSSPLPGVMAVPAIDYPTRVTELFAADHLVPFGGLAAFREQAFANLRALPPPQHQVVHADPERADADIHVFGTDDFFGAARLLVLDHLLASVAGIERPTHGCLVAIPNRHLLAVHVVAGPGLVAAMPALLSLAQQEHDTRPGPVSPELYFVPTHGAGQQLTDRASAPAKIVVDGALERTMHTLGLLGDGGRPGPP